MTLIKHHPRYWSPFYEVVQNTYVLKEDRNVYIGGPGTRGKKIAKLPKGTLVRIDEKEVNEAQGSKRAYYVADNTGYSPITGYFNDWIIAELQALWPNAPEEWQVWFDWSGLGTWPIPIPEPEPDPEPEPGTLISLLVKCDEEGNWTVEKL